MSGLARDEDAASVYGMRLRLHRVCNNSTNKNEGIPCGERRGRHDPASHNVSHDYTQGTRVDIVVGDVAGMSHTLSHGLRQGPWNR